MTAYQINPRPLLPSVKPVRDAKFLAYVRTFPCVGCKTQRKRRQAMHTGPHGIGQKASDLDCLPGCDDCHRELHKIGPVKFQEVHAIEFAAIQRMIRRFFRIKHGTPTWWPNQPSLVVNSCQCGHEDFEEEFQVSKGCPSCGRPVEERAA